MTCNHPVYSRYLGTEIVDGLEWIVAGCKECSATVKFPALAAEARKAAAIRADYERGMTTTLIAKRYGYRNRGTVVNMLHQLGVQMRIRGRPSGAPGKRANLEARRKMSAARRAWHAAKKTGDRCEI